MGGVIFIDLYDHKGVLQVVCDANHLNPDDFSAIEQLKNQSVLSVSGKVRLRDAETVNPRILTGTVEVRAGQITVLSQAEALPFSLEDGAREDVRLRYRYLDIRREQMQKNLRFRHLVQKAAQAFLDDHGFISVETPMLTLSTPEGARDYVVPSRVHKGKFYALPQSPQIFKQLLMVGGIDKYYQIARCFRDEDLRADRQPEFTQVDMEMSFVEQEDILLHLESLFKHIFYETMGYEIEGAFPRMTWKDAMDFYGSDKPDIRFDLKIADLTDVAAQGDFSVFNSVVSGGGVVRGITIPGGSSLTRSDIEDLTNKALSYGAKGMAWILRREDGELNSILTKYFTPEQMEALLDKAGCGKGDFLLFCADRLAAVRKTLGGLRQDIASMLDLRKRDDFQFLIVTDFPQFEYSEEEKRCVAMHHPFTMPYPEDVDKMISDPLSVRAQAYDVVLNGVELGSGSIRIHDSSIQKRVFEALGFSEEEIQNRFGFMVNAFRYGTPPHGGFAFGLDRLVMLLLGVPSLREVIAFPKTKEAADPMTDAPSVIGEDQLKLLGLDHIQTATSASAGVKKKINIDVEAVANLARLWIRPDEKEALADNLREIVEFAGQLSQIDTDDVPETQHAAGQQNVFRQDLVRPSIARKELLDCAPLTQDDFIYVPKVIE
jgi:aspartyl-tRNA synthetase